MFDVEDADPRFSCRCESIELMRDASSYNGFALSLVFSFRSMEADSAPVGWRAAHSSASVWVFELTSAYRHPLTS